MRKLKQITFLSLIFIITVAFNFSDNPPGGWYQQFLPNINGRQIVDMTFIDSLTGYIVTTRLASPDTSYILKTTNGGDSWNINCIGTGVIFKQVRFLNQNTGFVTGSVMLKTTNAGLNWFPITIPTPNEDIAILNQDTMWTAYSESLTGGVYRTTNGGLNWDRQLSLGSQNPTHIYFYNKDIGFISNTTGTYLRKTTNSGVNWVQIGIQGFTDIHFINDLTGWRSFGTMKKTTDGGLNWTNQPLPQGGVILTSQILKFSKISKDTIWGVGGEAFYGAGQFRGILYRTTNGGDNWQCQIPDTAIHTGQFFHVNFTDLKKGWAYSGNTGVHTKVGGDTTFLTPVRQISSEIPSDFILGQNYPNPFNPITNISFTVHTSGFITLKVYNLTGKEVIVLVNEKKNIGNYLVKFNGSNLSSGVYLYSLFVNGNIINTKKMMLVK